MANKLVFEGTATGAVKAVTDVADAFKKTTAEVDATTRASKKLEDQARKISEQADPQKKYNRQMAELTDHVNRNRVSMDDARVTAKRYGDELARAGDSGKRAFGGIGDALVGTVAGLVSAQQLISGIRQGIEAIKKTREEAAQSKLGAADSDELLRQSVVGQSSFNKHLALAGATDIAQDTNLPESAIRRALAGAISGQGNVLASIMATREAAKFTRNPAALEAITGGIVDVMNTAGIADPKEALGFIALTNAASRVNDPAKVAANIGKVVGAFTSPNEGGSAGFAAATFGAITKGATDPTGELSRTAAVLLVQQTKEFFANNRRGLSDEQIDTPDERILLLMNDRARAQKFLASVKPRLRSATKGGIEKLLLGDPEVRGAFDEFLPQLQDPKRRRSEAADAQAFIREGPIQEQRSFKQAIDSFTEQLGISGGSGNALDQDTEDKVVRLGRRLARTTLNPFAWAGEFKRYGLNLDPEEGIDMLDRAVAESRDYDQSLLGRMLGGSKNLRNQTNELIRELRKIQGGQKSRNSSRQE